MHLIVGKYGMLRTIARPTMYTLIFFNEAIMAHNLTSLSGSCGPAWHTYICLDSISSLLLLKCYSVTSMLLACK